MNLEENSFELEEAEAKMISDGNNRLGKVSLVLGIISIFYAPVIFGVLAIALSGRDDTSYAKAGRLMGVVGLGLWGYDIILRIISIISILF